jgi:hypothetical protein
MKWSPTSTFDRRAYSPENLGSVRQKDFCNTIPSRADVARPRAKFILSLVSQAIPIPLSSQKCLGQLQSLLAREQLPSRAPTRDIIPIEEPGFPAIRKANSKLPHIGTASCFVMRIWSAIDHAIALATSRIGHRIGDEQLLIY